MDQTESAKARDAQAVAALRRQADAIQVVIDKGHNAGCFVPVPTEVAPHREDQEEDKQNQERHTESDME